MTKRERIQALAQAHLDARSADHRYDVLMQATASDVAFALTRVSYAMLDMLCEEEGLDTDGTIDAVELDTFAP